jgi:UDP-N-acetylmuramoylalanine--D-glutamate ligase
MEDYAEAKANIFRHQHAGDVAIFNYDNFWTRRFGEEAPGEAWFTSIKRGGSFRRNSPGDFYPFVFTDSPLIGKHNRENVLLATTTARVLGISDDIIAAAVRSFQSVAHRLAEVAVIDGVRYINDTASTTPIAGQVAVEAFERPIVLVAGGNTKQLPLEDWPASIVRCCRDVVLLAGSGTDELIPALRQEAAKQGVNDPVRGIFDSFTPALDTAVSLTRPGDVLLFSPGFTSFGMFLNEFDRGDQFVAYVRRLEETASK